jgi:hypothetical protein
MLQRYWTLARERVADLSLRVAARARPSRPVVATEPPVATPPLSVGDRWMRATDAITEAIAGAGRVESLQAAAVDQIDAADYALRHLIAELSTAMPIFAADGSPLRALLATVAEKDSAAKKTLAA